jgi:tRNA A37 threonylcarbamoyladenosine biosynthesis protein TsaE
VKIRYDIKFALKKVVHKYPLEKLRGIAEEMADTARAPFSILLEGGIGAGKTTFSQFFIQRLAQVRKLPAQHST